METLPAPPRPLRLVRQLELGDCGAACLAMVLRAYGRPADLADLRDLTSTGRDGVSAAGIVAAAAHFGLAGEGIRCPADRLGELRPGTILHWGRNHFVVLEGPTSRGFRVLDPALGRRVVPADVLRERYSGVALRFQPDGSRTPATGMTDRQSRRQLYRGFVTGGRRPALLALACAAAVQAFALVHPAILRRVVGDLTTAGGEPRLARGLAIGVAALGIGYLAAYAGRVLFLVALQRTIDFRLTMGVLEHLVSLPYAFLARRSGGDLTLRLRSTVVVREILTSGALSALLDGALVLGYLVLILVVDAWFALFTTVAIALQIFIVAVSWPRLRLSSAEALDAQTVSQAQLLEIVDGLELLKASGAAERAVQRWSTRLRREVDAQAHRSRLGGIVDGALLTVRFVAPPALLALGLSRVSSGALHLDDMLALAALSAAITVPTGGLLGTVCSLSTVASYVERLDDLLRSRPEPAGRTPPDRLAGRVQLDTVSYSYSALLPPAVSEVSVEIKPGKSLAVVGASGSGKTTLAMLVATLYEPTAGAVRFDGVDAREYDPSALRARIGVVTQATRLFAATIRDNIVFGRDSVTDEEVVAAAMAAAIHEDVLRLPSGYDTMLGDGGAGLSGGQRQRLALARALAGKPGLLVLDEATSALDSVTESAVHESIAALECTRVVVAHRLSTITAADHILLLDGGRVVAHGTYKQVYRSSKLFRSLVAADAGE